MFWTVDRSTSERGITGLETAIILIAFVVVASVFAFTVLSMGIFASRDQKKQCLRVFKRRKAVSNPVAQLWPTKPTGAGPTLFTSFRS